jgi:S1-C subfamily serine protease
VQRVLEDSPAQAAGLRRGDLVVAAAEQPVGDPASLLRQVERSNVGEPLALSVIRAQKQMKLTIRPAALPKPG